MEDVKQQFANHLRSIGFEVGTPPQVILDKIRQRVGEERFAKLFSGKGGPSSTQSSEEFYKEFHDLAEANLMRSLDTNATLDASFELYRQCTTRLCEGTKVLELGCWTGGLASFIATRHPECLVTGVDMVPKIIEACNAFYQLPNLRFLKWNYKFGKPEELEPADVLLCAMGVVHHLPKNSLPADPSDVRGSAEYVQQRDHATGYFGIWRLAANPGAYLYAVLRLQLFPRFLAWIDAAQESGWTPRLDRVWRAALKGERSILPGLVFENTPSEPISEDAVLERWSWFHRGSELFACLNGGEALATYRSIGNKTVLAARDYQHEGAMTRDEVGSTGGIAYVFTMDAGAKYRLLLVSLRRAKQLAAAVSAKGSNTPITDEGSFKRTAAASGASPFAGAAPITTGGRAGGIAQGASVISLSGLPEGAGVRIVGSMESGEHPAQLHQNTETDG